MPKAKFFDEEYKRAATFGRQSSLSIVTQYNSSDWSSGWAHFVDGQTVFISPRHEQILDPGLIQSLNFKLQTIELLVF